MKHPIIAISLSVCLSVLGLFLLFDSVQDKNQNQSLTPVFRVSAVGNAVNKAIKPVVAVEKQAILEVKEVHDLISAAAKKHGVSPALVKGIVATESNFRCDARSSVGAIGLMQLMPATAQEYGADPSVPAQNIDAGTRYISFLLQKYKKSRNQLKFAIAAYNAGFGAVDRYRGIPPFRETRGYVTKVLGFMRKFESGRS
jgi:soluble lytic murein transglycosylase-like protein